MTPTEILPPTAHDRPAWLELWSAYQAFYGVDIPAATSDETWRRLLDRDEPVWAALAWRGGTAIGLVQWIYHRSTWSVSDFCYLNDLFVAPDARGGGIGRALIMHVHGEAERSGCGRLYWLTHKTNTQAMKVYDAVAANSGFVQYRMPL